MRNARCEDMVMSPASLRVIRKLFHPQLSRFGIVFLGIVFSGIFLGAIGSVANGQDLPELPIGDKSQSSEPSSLARGSYVERQKATLEMWRQRSLSRQAVQDAARDADPEVAERGGVDIEAMA